MSRSRSERGVVESLEEPVLEAVEPRHAAGFDARLDQRLDDGHVRVAGQHVARVFHDDARPARAGDEVPCRFPQPAAAHAAPDRATGHG
jgi:hypothetical protein